MRITKICTGCGKPFNSFTVSKNTFCKTCYKKNYTKQHGYGKIQKICLDCGAVFFCNRNNKYGLCRKCSLKKYQHEYYLRVTKPKRKAKRELQRKGLIA